ncbi:MAG: hypothetical protein ACK5W9_13575 [Bdellovibrionales bacterium]
MKFILLLFIPQLLFSQTRTTPSETRLTYDISASQSQQNGRTYQEVNLGLNWFFNDWLIWRNSGFQRQAQQEDTVYGLDSSLRFQKEFQSENRVFGLKLFGGPGVRLASEKSNATFAEAGLGLRLGGLQLGAGIKSLQYTDSRKDSNGDALPKTENQFFITLSGSGTL